jgi:hypothetical protein
LGTRTRMAKYSLGSSGATDQFALIFRPNFPVRPGPSD